MKFQISFVLALFLSLATQAYSQACVTPNTSHWRMTTIAEGMAHPVAMSMAPGDSVVFMVEMWSGNVLRYTPSSGVDTLKTLDVYIDNGRTSTQSGYHTGNENGLLGIAVDPNFEETNWIYVFYADRVGNSGTQHNHVLSRYTVSGNTLIAKKEILIIPRDSKYHAAGGMDIHPITGALYIGTGDDRTPHENLTKWGPRQDGITVQDALASSGSTKDLRGKVLRILPINFPDSETPAVGLNSTYKTPSDNLFPPTALTSSEIYSMGHRNPYHVRVDPYTNWAIVGDVGPDAGSDDPNRGPKGHDEFNLLYSPGNYGWPFAIADNRPYRVYNGEASAYTKGDWFDLNNLRNESILNTDGLKPVPPARAAFAWYNANGDQTGPNSVFGSGGESAIGGPMYHYEDTLSSNVKWPAYYNGKFIVADYVRDRVFALELNADTTLKKVELVKSGLEKLIDLDMGPKGDLYILQYAATGSGYHGGSQAGRLSKMEYIGPQYAATQCTHFIPPKATYETTSSIERVIAANVEKYQLYANLSQASSLLIPEGVHSISVYDLQGQEIAVLSNFEGKQKVTMPKILGHDGVVYLKYHR